MTDALLDTPGVCLDAEAVREAPSLQCAWEGAFDYELDERLWWWFAGAFLPPDEFARMRRGCDSVRGVFLDLARLSYATTGAPTSLPEPLIREIQKRLIVSMRPSAYRVATGATKQPFARVSSVLARLTEEIAWRVRS